MYEIVGVAEFANRTIVIAFIGLGECLREVNIYNLIIFFLRIFYLFLKLHLNLCFFFINYSQLGPQDKRTGEKPFVSIELWDRFLWWL